MTNCSLTIQLPENAQYNPSPLPPPSNPPLSSSRASPSRPPTAPVHPSTPCGNSCASSRHAPHHTLTNPPADAPGNRRSGPRPRCCAAPPSTAPCAPRTRASSASSTGSRPRRWAAPRSSGVRFPPSRNARSKEVEREKQKAEELTETKNSDGRRQARAGLLRAVYPRAQGAGWVQGWDEEVAATLRRGRRFGRYHTPACWRAAAIEAAARHAHSRWNRTGNARIKAWKRRIKVDQTHFVRRDTSKASRLALV